MRQSTDEPAGSSLSAFAAVALGEHYGLQGRLEAVPGEHDANFKVTAADGQVYLFKLHAADLDPSESALQAAALRHLELHAPELPIQRLFLGLNGDISPVAIAPDARLRRLRLTTFIDGETWAAAKRRGAREAASLGRLLGRLDRSLSVFHHPAARRPHFRDLARAGEHIADLPLIDDAAKRETVGRILMRFADAVAPRLADRPKQAIHNDADDCNVLFDPHGEVAGLLDFGDMVESWRVNEVAVACAYAMIGAVDPVAAALPLIAAYHDEFPLDETEADLLFDLILTRYAVSICAAAGRIREHPSDTCPAAGRSDVWEMLQRLSGANRRVAIMRIRAACRFDAVPNRRRIETWLERNGYRFQPVLHRELTLETLGVIAPVAGLPASSADLNEAICEHWQAALGKMQGRIAVGPYGEDRASYGDGSQAPSRSIHMAIDLFAPAGEPVFSPFAGTVALAGVDSCRWGFGGTLVLEHATDDGTPFWTLYGHLAPESVAGYRVGAAIHAGAKIARLGGASVNGGWPPHLHFQLLTDLYARSIDDIIGIAPRDEWEVWESVSPNPNAILGLPVACSLVVARDAAWLRRERRYRLGRSLSLAYAEPLKIVRGSGVHLIDDRGRSYLDMVNNVSHVGHCHPRVVAAAQRQMAELNTNSRYLHDTLVEYTRRLAATLPPELSVVFLVNSGSEANDLALRLARAYTGNTDIVTVDHAYHGHLTSLIEISPYKFAGRGGEGRKSHVWVTEMPDLYRGRFRYDDPEAGPRYAEKVATLIRDMGGLGRKPAAFFSEGILGTGGQLALPDRYLAAAYGHVRAAGGICVADEVQIGFGRVGTHMWAFETQGVVPDIVTMGKPIGNGHPMAAVVTRPAIAAAFANGMEYFNTFGGNPVSAAVGLAVLDVIRDERLMHNAAAVGARMVAGLHALAQRHGIIGDVRGLGLFLGVELVRDRTTLEPAATELAAVIEAMKARQVLLSSEGPYHNVLKIKPPIVFSAANCDEFLEKLDASLGEVRP